MEEQVPALVRLPFRAALDHAQVLLLERALADGRGEGGGRPAGPGADHHAPHAPVQAVDGEDLSAQLAGEKAGEGVAGALLAENARGLQTDRQLAVLI